MKNKLTMSLILVLAALFGSHAFAGVLITVNIAPPAIAVFDQDGSQRCAGSLYAGRQQFPHACHHGPGRNCSRRLGLVVATSSIGRHQTQPWPETNDSPVLRTNPAKEEQAR